MSKNKHYVTISQTTENLSFVLKRRGGIFLDDMIDVPEVSKVFCYADDTKLLCHGEFCLNSAQNDLCSLWLWAYCNYLSFNSAESGYLHISRMSLNNILLGDVEIPSLDNITDLGIEVSKTLKWSLHFQTKIVKARRSFNYLKHSVPFNLPSGVKFNLFKAWIPCQYAINSSSVT